ncbi:MAG: N-acyl homoserine lactonase family protein [Aggregatilineales bacterium]
MIKVHAIQTGSVAIKQRQRAGQGAGMLRLINTLRDSEWAGWLPIYAWLIEHDGGLTIVDTGETARTAEAGYLPKWHPFHRFGVRMNVQPQDEIDVQLTRLGYSPDDLTRVVMTHLHTDHAGGLPHFPNTPILVSREEYGAASGFSGRLNGYLNQHYPAWFNPTLIDFNNTPYATFSRSYALTPDITLVPTPGHSAGHLSVIVRDSDVHYFIAGDTSYTEQLLLDQTVDGVSVDTAAAKDTLARILGYVEQYPTVYLPAHDPESVTRLENKHVVHSSVSFIR